MKKINDGKDKNVYLRKYKHSHTFNHPQTGLPVFGIFPEIIQNKKILFNEGPIFLRFGEHFAKNRGWGLEHIWKAHYSNIVDIEDAITAITGFILSILVPNSKVHYEFGVGSSGRRLTVFRNLSGVVIVEERFDGKNNCYYSIVTAYPATKANGPVVGAIK